LARPSTEMIARVPLFSGLERRDLERVADSFKERNYAAGDTIAEEGSGGAGFFVIAEGNAKVTVQGQERATLGPGDYFGEIALLDEGARTATVKAETPMKTYAMTFWEFRPIVETDARIAWKLVQALAHRLRERANLAFARHQVSSERDQVVARPQRVARERDRLGAGQRRLDDTPEHDAAGAAGPPHDLAGCLPERRRRVDAAFAGDDEIEAGWVEADRVEHERSARHELGAERRERRAEPTGGAARRRVSKRRKPLRGGEPALELGHPSRIGALLRAEEARSLQERRADVARDARRHR
jgi:CRP/FNR family transcriptional regulator, cyclic AMP receptor protein